MKRFEIVPRRHYVNRVTGATASIYGACPWNNDAESEAWEVVTDGYTIRDNKTGTVGGYGMPKEPSAIQAFMAAKHGSAWEYIEL